VIKLSEHYVYWGFHESIGYAGIELSGLPEKITVEGYEMIVKSEFHITLINLEDIAALIDKSTQKKNQSELIDEVRKYLKRDKLDKFDLSNKFRFVQKDIRKSVIVMCQLHGADKLFASLCKKYEVDIPLQPFHITLYALPKDRGIGLLSSKELDKYSVPIELPELKNLKKAGDT
jgi:hypothetical protein